MRVVFLHGAEEWEGRARVFTAVARGLAERGYESWLAAPAGSEVAMQAVARGVPVIALPPHRGAWARARTLRSRLPPDFVDAVFVHDDEEHLTAALAVRRARRGLVVRRVGAGEEFTPSWRGRRAQQLAATRILYTTASPPSGTAAPSGTLPAMRAELGVVVPPPGATGEVAGIETTVVACIATRQTVRRATNVVRAAALLAQRHAGLRLRVIGSAAYEQDLKLLAAALGIGRRVEWIGHPVDMSLSLSGVDAGWVVADRDDAALGCLDLLSHGIPVLAERTAVSARYVSSGIHGTLMANLSPPLMAAETAILLSDSDRRAAMGMAGRLRAEREFPLREMLAGFEHTVRSVGERAVARP